MSALGAIKRGVRAAAHGAVVPTLAHVSRVSLDASLLVVAALSRAVDTDRFPSVDKAARALGLSDDERVRFARAAWSGHIASEVLLARARKDPVRGALADVVADVGRDDALRRIEQAADKNSNRGVIIAAVHMGPARVLSSFIHRRFPAAVFLLRSHEEAPPGARVLIVNDDHDASRAAALVAARQHLRDGGVVYLAPDGVSGARALEIPVGVGAGVFTIRRGGATLARLARVPAYPVFASWAGSGARIVCGDELGGGESARSSSSDADAWERAWLRRYIDHVERWTRETPQNFRLKGSLYELWSERAPHGR